MAESQDGGVDRKEEFLQTKFGPGFRRGFAPGRLERSGGWTGPRNDAVGGQQPNLNLPPGWRAQHPNQSRGQPVSEIPPQPSAEELEIPTFLRKAVNWIRTLLGSGK